MTRPTYWSLQLRVSTGMLLRWRRSQHSECKWSLLWFWLICHQLMGVGGGGHGKHLSLMLSQSHQAADTEFVMSGDGRKCHRRSSSIRYGSDITCSIHNVTNHNSRKRNKSIEKNPQILYFQIFTFCANYRPNIMSWNEYCRMCIYYTYIGLLQCDIGIYSTCENPKVQICSFLYYSVDFVKV